MDIKKIILLFCFLFYFGHIFSQIKTKEKLVYTASYNMSGLMTQFAQVTMGTNLVNTSKKTYLHLSWEAYTYSKWDSFFKIRDVYESYVDPSSLKPSLYKRNIYEGGYLKLEKYVFNTDGSSVTCTSKKKDNPTINSKFRIGSNSQDIISIAYKLRTVNFGALKPGQIISYVIVFDQKEFPVTFKYMGKETITNAFLGSKECYKVSITSKTDVLKGADKNLIWLTADANRIPLMLKFSIAVGTGQLILINVL